MPEKKIWGRKRHILVDTQGFVLAAKVHTAGISDREGAKRVLATLVGAFPRISHLFADHGYTGPLTQWIKEQRGWETEIVPKPTNDPRYDWVLIDGLPVRVPKPKGGFQVQRKRWVVERTFAWKWACSSCEGSLRPNLHLYEMSPGCFWFSCPFTFAVVLLKAEAVPQKHLAAV
jgi:transposase